MKTKTQIKAGERISHLAGSWPPPDRAAPRPGACYQVWEDGQCAYVTCPYPPFIKPCP